MTTTSGGTAKARRQVQGPAAKRQGPLDPEGETLTVTVEDFVSPTTVERLRLPALRLAGDA